MKELTLKIFCLHLKLYKIGLSIAFIYITVNLITIWSVYYTSSEGNADHAVALFCWLTIMTSVILFYGLLKNRHTLLLPWLANVAVLMLFNIFAIFVQFEEAHRHVSRVSFYWAFGFFIAFEVQMTLWYTIYRLLREGHRKTMRIMANDIENSDIKTITSKDTFKLYVVGNENRN